MPRTARVAVGALVGAVLVSGAALAVVNESAYRIEIVMPSAEGTFEGDDVVIAGRNVGTVTDLDVVDGKALVTATIDDDSAPLHYGTVARITWEAVISGRFLELLPGPETNPEIPSGSRIESMVERVELDDVLAALDADTMTDVSSLVQNLRATLQDREGDVNETLRTGGPAFAALGEVMTALGTDGPAIRRLVTQLREVTETLNSRDEKLAASIGDLAEFTTVAATQEERLAESIGELPATLDTAGRTLDKVPAAVDETVPLLETLRPATAKLPAVAGDLVDVLRDLRPALGDLRPTLEAADGLLGRTPGVLDKVHDVAGPATEAVTRLQPAVAFLRPYAPEAAGWLINWTSIWSGEDATGNYARPLVTAGPTAANLNPGVIPPGLARDERPAPGAIVGQPWHDADGDGVR
jgi:phospholipid/cholesterol/gamma-HCH transport system substrate-binding protein